MIGQERWKMWKTFENFCRNWKFHVKRDACWRKINGKIVAFLSSVVYYFEDLLKSGHRALVQNKTFISLYFDRLLSLSHSLQWGNCNRRGDFKVTCRLLVDVQVPECNNFGFSIPRMTGNSAPLYLLGNINSPINSLTTLCFQKIRLENVFSTFHHQEIPRIGIVFVGLLRDLSWEVKILHLCFSRRRL